MDKDEQNDTLLTPIHLGAAGAEYEDDVLRHLYTTLHPQGRLVYPAAVLKAPSVRGLVLTDAPDVDLLQVVKELEQDPPPTGNVVGLDALHFDAKPLIEGAAMLRDKTPDAVLLARLLRELRDSIVLVEIKLAAAVTANAVAGAILVKLALLSAGDGDGPVVRRRFQLVSTGRVMPVLESAPHGLPSGGGLFHDHIRVEPSERVVQLQKCLSEAPSVGTCNAFAVLEDVLEAVENSVNLEGGASTLPTRKALIHVISNARKQFEEHNFKLYAAREAIRASKKRRVSAISAFEAAEEECV